MGQFSEPRSEIDEGIRLVLGIARLGEQGLRGWWRSHGLGKGGQYVLATAFPRTAKPAALELDVVSAARRHDDLLGRPTALHLFSSAFPFRRWAEAWLAEQKTLAPDALFDELANWNVDSALATLRDWAGDPPAGESIGEGLLLGQLTNEEMVNDEASVSYAKLLAAAYLNQNANLRPPYFDLRN